MPTDFTKTRERRIVFVDVDGTITDNSGAVPASTPTAIRQTRERGHLVLLCTGRAYRDIPEEVLAIGFDGAVTNGGATVVFGDKTLLNQTLTVEQATRMLDYFDSNGLQYIAQTTGLTHRSTNYVSSMEQYQLMLSAEGVEADFSEIIDWLGLMPLIDTVDLNTITKAAFVGLDPELLPKAKAELGDDFYIVNGSLPNAAGFSGEIAPPGITKGTGVEMVLDHLRMSKEQAIGIGDSHNDVDMFEACGTSIAMGNGESVLKEIANFVTADVDADGVELALAKLGLIEPSE
ncbi:HAD family hydrolase [Actinomycetaceae bacterium MB13-C1-2]|nr:HAD family hydrolase [Actinomycetaceae bacterium MB13-C1-2]